MLRGDAIAFPDADCWYPDRLLEQVGDLLIRRPEWDGVNASYQG